MGASKDQPPPPPPPSEKAGRKPKAKPKLSPTIRSGDQITTDDVEHLIAAIRILKGVDDHNLEPTDESSDDDAMLTTLYNSPLEIYHGLHIAWIALFRSWERIRKHGFSSPEDKIEADEQSVDKTRLEIGMDAIQATLLNEVKEIQNV